MTTIKPMLNSRPNKEGRYTLILQIVHNRRRGVVCTPYRLCKDEFDAQKGKAVALNHSRSARAFALEVNDYLTTQTEVLNGVITALEARGEPFLPTDITAAYRHLGDNRFIHTYTLALVNELEREERHGTARTYRSTLAVFERFMGNARCRFSELDGNRLAGFEQYLKRIPVQRNTITFYMRILRSIYNQAKRAGLTGNHENPFEAVSFRMDKTRKLAVSPEMLKRVAEADFGSRQHLGETRDLFMFSFYARGMSFVDIAYLTRDKIQNGVIRYTRRKTGQLFSVRVTPPLQAIIDRYQHCSPWVMPVMKGSALNWDAIPDMAEHAPEQLLYKRYELALSRYLFHLGEISEELETEKKLTFNVARHSWASLARKRGIAVALISEGLGHTSEKTTSIYLDELDSRELDKANEIVIRF